MALAEAAKGEGSGRAPQGRNASAPAEDVLRDHDTYPFGEFMHAMQAVALTKLIANMKKSFLKWSLMGWAVSSSALPASALTLSASDALARFWGDYNDRKSSDVLAGLMTADPKTSVTTSDIGDLLYRGTIQEHSGSLRERTDTLDSYSGLLQFGKTGTSISIGYTADARDPRADASYLLVWGGDSKKTKDMPSEGHYLFDLSGWDGYEKIEITGLWEGTEGSLESVVFWGGAYTPKDIELPPEPIAPPPTTPEPPPVAKSLLPEEPVSGGASQTSATVAVVDSAPGSLLAGATLLGLGVVERQRRSRQVRRPQ